jgi:hypothetical protein
MNITKSFPNIVKYKNNNISITKENNIWTLYANNNRWMTWDLSTNAQLFEFYSHYTLAKGHCICTGLGFLLRENLLLQKPEVTKITVIEKNEELINYHKNFNPRLMNKIEVINCDANDYKGRCDTLLIDNFEPNTNYFEYDLLCNVANINKNITCDVMWFWPLEHILNAHYKNYIGLNLQQIYENIKKYFGLTKLPVLSEKELLDFCKMFFMNNFNECNFTMVLKGNDLT